MSYIIDAWEADGPKGEVGLAVMRCNRRSQFADFVRKWKANPKCVLITKSFSERNRTWEVLYVKPGYSSETTPPGTVAETPRTGRKPKDFPRCAHCGQVLP